MSGHSVLRQTNVSHPRSRRRKDAHYIPAHLRRSNTLAVNMQAEIFSAFPVNCRCKPVRGWIVKGAAMSVLSVTNIVAMVENRDAACNPIFAVLEETARVSYFLAGASVEAGASWGGTVAGGWAAAAGAFCVW